MRPRFVLPGRWGRIGLESPGARRRSAKRLVESALGRADELASARGELRGRIETVAELAATSGAADLYFALEIADGVPFPAWLTVYRLDAATLDLPALGLERLTRFLSDSLDGGYEPMTPAETFGVVRHAWRRPAGGPADDIGEMVEVDYWVAAAEPARIARLTFASPMIGYQDELIDLFDAIIGTLEWPVEAAHYN
ncbi:hypothetical protein [Pseudolysinimonas sp.]|jgi:hypothetical protein|uniref:hypothetical protein n=1 Tax=Pseudolysinimonas sp. TaxID=2680009 RepID=UPI0037835EBD